MQQLPIIALIVGILLLVILVSCDEDSPGSSNWNTENIPASHS